VNPKTFFGELKRRNVYKVAFAYGVVGWLLIQIASQVFSFFEIPNWAVRFVVLAIIIGFPIALILAWAFELTPEGVKRTEAADAAHERSRGVVWIYIIAIGAALSVSLFILGRYTAQREASNEVSVRDRTAANQAIQQSVPEKSVNSTAHWQKRNEPSSLIPSRRSVVPMLPRFTWSQGATMKRSRSYATLSRQIPIFIGLIGNSDWHWN
jgi:hypothetical protein